MNPWTDDPVLAQLDVIFDKLPNNYNLYGILSKTHNDKDYTNIILSSSGCVACAIEQLDNVSNISKDITHHNGGRKLRLIYPMRASTFYWIMIHALAGLNTIYWGVELIKWMVR